MHRTFDRLRLERGAHHLHSPGPNALARFIEDLSARIGEFPATMGLLAEYETEPTVALIRVARLKRASPCFIADAAGGARQG